MKPIQTYTLEAIEKLRQWITDMNAKGDTKYFEIFVDDIRIVSKTNDVDSFDSFEDYMNEDTQHIKVRTYNTQNSHRSTQFEFRTSNYIPKTDHKELSNQLQKTNDELLKRLSDAELYIKKLELNQSTNSNNNSPLDFPAILSMFGDLAKANPELSQNLGIGSLINIGSQNTESKNTEADLSEHIWKQASEKLNAEDFASLKEVNGFFKENPSYIKIVLESLRAER